jgi:hypothetical protein
VVDPMRNNMPAKSPKPPANPKKWRVYHLGGKGELLGTVMAANAARPWTRR